MTSIRVIDGAELDPQAVLLPSAPAAALLTPLRDRHRLKPDGGLWTSTYRGPDAISDWWAWASGNMPEMVNGRGIYLIRPATGLTVAVVDGPADAASLFGRYGWTAGAFDHPLFNRLDYGAMASDGLAALRFTREALRLDALAASPLDLAGFEVESTVWWAWPGDDWELVGWADVERDQDAIAEPPVRRGAPRPAGSRRPDRGSPSGAHAGR